MNAYSQDLRDKLIDLYKSGNYTKIQLHKLLKIGYSTVKTWCSQYDKTGKSVLIRSHKEGRKILFDDREAILTYLRINPEASGKQMHIELAPHITQSCFYMTLKRLEITYKKSRKIQKAL